MREFLRKLNKTEIRNSIAIISISGSFAMLILLIFHPIPERNVSSFNLALGMVLGVCVSGVIGYFFGASKKNDNENNTNNPTVL